MCVGLKVVEVMWGAHLCNVSCIDWRVRSVLCVVNISKRVFVSSPFCSSVSKLIFL